MTQAKPEGSQLQRAIASGRFVITAEITPPVSCDRDDVLAKGLPLKGLADAVNVTDGAGARAHLGAQAAAIILLENGIEPVLQLTCRDRNRLALQSDLLGAAALGIRNLLVLRGDDPARSIRPRTGSRKALRQRSAPARSSRRPNSAWISRWCGATWRGLQSSG
jgi:5,10-methylenetetrahydrofolate reductase